MKQYSLRSVMAQVTRGGESVVSRPNISLPKVTEIEKIVSPFDVLSKRLDQVIAFYGGLAFRGVAAIAHGLLEIADASRKGYEGCKVLIAQAAKAKDPKN
ncbi:hypothetical protein AALP_AA3G130100 [Arabis alpina]|uniref:Uncharacterized protein n=1 Tax=Arabis alpina TaxID=50452 RepID=A0A087H8W1_ARAAL|nr:hypothetical protein AALP_AA3G130100 [Arabis alpina]